MIFTPQQIAILMALPARRREVLDAMYPNKPPLYEQGILRSQQRRINLKGFGVLIEPRPIGRPKGGDDMLRLTPRGEEVVRLIREAK